MGVTTRSKWNPSIASFDAAYSFGTAHGECQRGPEAGRTIENPRGAIPVAREATCHTGCTSSSPVSWAIELLHATESIETGTNARRHLAKGMNRITAPKT